MRHSTKSYLPFAIFCFSPTFAESHPRRYVIPFNELRMSDVEKVGGRTPRSAR